jgi:SAM-dependent methyltransferase
MQDPSVAECDPQLLRSTFDQVPELYDRARPTYPAEVFDDLAALAHLPAGARIVEIGCGTGQATLALAERGYRVTCVELGAGLAGAARRKLSRFSGVEVINANFETWEPAHAGFDAVVAFTAFHWIRPDLRYERSASLLREGGILAVVGTQHVLPRGGDEFFLAVQEDYDAVVPDEPSTKAGAPVHPDAIEDLTSEIDASGFFRNVASRRYVWDVTYTADEYVAVLSTYSGHLALDDATRESLLARIHDRIEARPGGTVRKTYLALLDVAERLP